MTGFDRARDIMRTCNKQGIRLTVLDNRNLWFSSQPNPETWVAVHRYRAYLAVLLAGDDWPDLLDEPWPSRLQDAGDWNDLHEILDDAQVMFAGNGMEGRDVEVVAAVCVKLSANLAKQADSMKGVPYAPKGEQRKPEIILPQPVAAQSRHHKTGEARGI